LLKAAKYNTTMVLKIDVKNNRDMVNFFINIQDLCPAKSTLIS